MKHTVSVRWSMARRIWSSNNREGHLHGHDFSASIVLDTPRWDDERPFDIAPIHRLVHGHIVNKWCHSTALAIADPLLAVLRSAALLDGSPMRVHALPYEPTAANLAHLLCTDELPRLLAGRDCAVLEVTVNESPFIAATINETDP